MSVSTVDNEFEVLHLDASPYEQLSSLTDWHLSFASDFPESFYDVNTVLGSLGIKRAAQKITRKEFNVVMQVLSPSRNKQFIHQLRTLAYLPENTSIGIRIKQPPIEKKKSLSDNLAELVKDEKRSEKNSGPLKERIWISLFAIESERDRRIAIRRLGLDGEPPNTLEELGVESGVSRERVRQIERKVLRLLKRRCLWDDVFRDEITSMFRAIGPLIDVEKLASYSPWFEDFSLTKGAWDLFLKSFAPSVSTLLREKKMWLIPEESSELLESCLIMYHDLARKGAEKAELIEGLGSHFGHSHAEHLYDEFGSTRSGDLTIATMASVFLKESHSPVSAEEFFAYCVKKSSKDLSSKFRYVENALANEAVPVSRKPTRYATKQTLGLSESELNDYADAFYGYWIDNFDRPRIFPGDEVRDWADKNGFIFNMHEDWNSWLATAPLKLDPQGRFKIDRLVIALNEVWCDQEVPTRMQFVSELLRVKRYPMRTKEIRRALHSKIGMGDFFQLHDGKEILALGDGRFTYRESF